MSTLGPSEMFSSYVLEYGLNSPQYVTWTSANRSGRQCVLAITNAKGSEDAAGTDKNDASAQRELLKGRFGTEPILNLSP